MIAFTSTTFAIPIAGKTVTEEYHPQALGAGLNVVASTIPVQNFAKFKGLGAWFLSLRDLDIDFFMKF